MAMVFIIVMVVFLGVEEVASRLLDFLVEFKHLNDVGLLPTVAWTTLMRVLFLAFLVTK